MYISKEKIQQKKYMIDEKRKNRFIFSKNITFKTLGYAVLFLYVFISIMPFIWAVIASFKNPYLLSITGLNPFPKIGGWTTINYVNLFNGAAGTFLGQWVYNTILYSVSSSILNATLNLLGGYALAQIAMRGKKIIVSYFLVSILIPSQATFIPTFYIFTKLGIISTTTTSNFFIFMIVFSGMANIILTFMARQFFLTQTPELEKAAEMEGYSKISIFFSITIRKMLPLFFTQIVLVFMGSWNNYLTFTLFSVGHPNKMTINSGIIIIARNARDKQMGYGQMLAMSNLSFIPMMGIYLISLKVQLRGIKGGNK